MTTAPVFSLVAILLVFIWPYRAHSQSSPQAAEQARWAAEAKNVTIVRDDWGIAHVTGETDADAVFGMIYAQAEDDFNRIETNYLNAMGRLAETEGKNKIYQDLRVKLFIDPDDLQKEYAESPEWLRKLMDAFADGLNFYLAQHPEVTPRVIRHFEPWMALSFTEGSIGGDIERVDLQQLQAFYAKPPGGVSQRSSRTELSREQAELEPGGSNGIAIAPSNTAGHHSLLLINPHTSFFFRSELQMISKEGLDAYGAVTWGQFFVYQGFNSRVGWMHTSSGVDAVDEYLETVHGTGGHYRYQFGNEERPVIIKQIMVPYRTAHGMAKKKFTVYYTHHGPVIGEQNGKWVSIQLMQEHVKALMQSYLRTKATNYQEYLKTMDLEANSSNNTVYADADGHIAYFQGNYIPRRDTRFDFTKPVDGSNPATDWHGLLSVAETPHLLDPKSGYLFNVNDSPWNGAGESSLRRQDYPVYVETGGESARGLHAMRLLQGREDFTLDGLVTAAYDSYLPWFIKPLSALISDWSKLPSNSELKSNLAPQIAVLRKWDLRWGVDSVATTLAIYWGTEIAKAVKVPEHQEEFSAPVLPADQALKALVTASAKLTAAFGTWQKPWGEVNRFQRLSDSIEAHFDDAKPSIPVGFTASTWGSLAAFGAIPYPGTKKWYGFKGNSFVAVVEFGDKVRARAVTAGGESGHPASKHFNDQAERYCTGNLREVYFYPDQLRGHTERTYHPGNAGYAVARSLKP
ncbi:MAG: penicillin acylase family protein [Acidobacteriaceae bacterium]